MERAGCARDTRSHLLALRRDDRLFPNRRRADQRSLPRRAAACACAVAVCCRHAEFVWSDYASVGRRIGLSCRFLGPALGDSARIAAASCCRAGSEGLAWVAGGRSPAPVARLGPDAADAACWIVAAAFVSKLDSEGRRLWAGDGELPLTCSGGLSPVCRRAHRARFTSWACRSSTRKSPPVNHCASPNLLPARQPLRSRPAHAIRRRVAGHRRRFPTSPDCRSNKTRALRETTPGFQERPESRET